MADPLLEIRNLSSERDDRLLFSDVCFTVGKGQIIQVAGPNGSGKTTLLRILAGLSTRFEGSVLWEGKDFRLQRQIYREQSLYFGHGIGNKGVLSPLENLRWSCAVRGLSAADETLFAALKKVGLAGYEQQPCQTLSAGQQRRAALARLFCQPARLWILDEPFTAIDQRGVVEIEHWLADFRDAGGAIVLTTHHRLDTRLAPHVVELGEGYERVAQSA